MSVQALVAVLHIGYRVPMKMVKRMLRELFGLRISAGEVVALLDGVKLAGEGRRQQLLEQDADRPQVGAWVEALRAVGGPTCATLCQVSRRAPAGAGETPPRLLPGTPALPLPRLTALHNSLSSRVNSNNRVCDPGIMVGNPEGAVTPLNLCGSLAVMSCCNCPAEMSYWARP